MAWTLSGRTFAGFARDERGATAIEYGLIVALIGIAMMAALGSLGGGVGGMWTKLNNAVQSS